MKHLVRAAGILVGILFVAFILPKLVPSTTVEGYRATVSIQSAATRRETSVNPIC
jgi:hypothetical protein